MLKNELKIDVTGDGAASVVGAMALSKWLKLVGVSKMTAWRWEKKGYLKTENLCGRRYVTSAAIAEFERRLKAGHFAKEIKPKRGRKAGVHA